MIDSIKFGLLNANSVKKFNDPVRNVELLKICKVHDIIIISETKLQSCNIIKIFNRDWIHQFTNSEDNGAGISIAYNTLLGTPEKITLNIDGISCDRIIACLFLPPNKQTFIVLGVYFPASGTVAVKLKFIQTVFDIRFSLAEKYKCLVILGGDFNMLISDYKNVMTNFPDIKPPSYSFEFSKLINSCNYHNPFTLHKDFAFRYLTFEGESNGIKYCKGIDHFLLPKNVPVKNLSISTNFFSTSKHKIISIEIENLWIRPLDSIVKKKNCYIPIGIWAEPEFIEESNNLIMSDTKWIDKFDDLIDKIKNIALSVKKRLKRTFIVPKNNYPSGGFSFLIHNGKTTSDFSEMKICAKDHFQNHFAEQFVFDNFNYENLTTISDDDNISLSKQFTLEEIKVAILSTKSSCPGEDNVPIELFQNLPNLNVIIMEMINLRKFPDSSRSIIFRLIHKVGSCGNLDSYRPIGLMNMISRILGRVIANRLQNVLPYIIGKHQFAYIKGRSGTNIANIINEMLVNIDDEHCPLLMKLDFKSAFD